MKTETCPTCGGSGVVEDDLAEFETKIPEGCVCHDEGWWMSDINDVCDNYVKNKDADSNVFPDECKTCEHDEACHK